ncbi:MAG: hypothetical protein HZC55_11630 [Verrucomicrobia bacterium]|nr:hypothetical protein [Verrucomicrobiota bacterium]
MKLFRTLSSAAALLGACLQTPAHGATEPLRLDRVGVVRFTPSGTEQLVRTEGVLFDDGRVAWGASREVVRPNGVPDWALGRLLILREAWLAYRALGYGALANFQLGSGSVLIPVGDVHYWAIEPNPDARYASGKVINLSTRARLAGAGDTLIAGFVIEGRPRWVLVRGVGPSLAALGVSGALADPFVSIRRGSTPFLMNDDWSSRHDAAEIQAAAARVGAFPLAEGSKDAALLVELLPGAYTVTVEAAGPAIAGGEVLVEIYSVPEPE